MRHRPNRDEHNRFSVTKRSVTVQFRPLFRKSAKRKVVTITIIDSLFFGLESVLGLLFFKPFFDFQLQQLSHHKA